MSRRAAMVQATHQPCPGEAFLVEIVVYDGFPDMLGTARAEAVRGVRDMAANALETYGRIEPQEGDDEAFEALVTAQDEDDGADD